METYKLRDPFEVQNKGTVKELHIQAPKLGHSRAAAEEYPGDLGKQSQFILAKCCGLVYRDLDDMSLFDFDNACDIVWKQGPEKKADSTKPTSA